MANEISNGDNVLVEFSENNILLVDPNRVFEGGRVKDRLVDSENLVIYASLKARVVPRSKLISGAGVDNQTPEAFVDVFEGEINFLKPQGKDYYTSDWTDTQTGKGFGSEAGSFNQRVQTSTIGANGQLLFKEQIRNKIDSEGFGINNISVTLNRAFTPIVNITFTDVRGQTLFEQGPNSPYAAFFQLPYPLFKLKLKGYYGKAVEYQLMLEKFNASFDSSTGNYNVTCNFKGRVTALLADITLQEMRIAPYMFARSYEIETGEDEKSSFISSRGRQTLSQVYAAYKSKGLIGESLPDLTIDDLIERIKQLETDIEKKLKSYNLDALDDIETYDKYSTSYRNKILASGGWRATYIDNDINSVSGPQVDISTDVVYYQFKKTYRDNPVKQKDAFENLKKRIKEGNEALLRNKTFGKGGKQAIPVDIKLEDFESSPPTGFEDSTSNWFRFDVFEEKIGKIITVFNTKRTEIETTLTSAVNEVVIESLGFNPTVRNIFAIMIAHADTFLRLMDETHTQAFEVRDELDRLNAVKGPGNPSSADEDVIVYPWPHYYIEETTENGPQYVSTYPGSPKVLGQTKAYNATLWPEVNFVEEFFKAQVISNSDTKPEFSVNTVGGNWVPISSFELGEEQVYINKATVPFNYEIWDRSVAFSCFYGLATRLKDNVAKNTYYELSKIEAANIKEYLTGLLDLNELLKNQNFDYNTYIDYLQQISPLNNYQLLLRDQFSTPYIREKVNNSTFTIRPFNSFKSLTYQLNDGEIESSLESLNTVLASGNIRENNILETFPFSHFVSNAPNTSWTVNNLAGGVQISSYENLNSISQSISYQSDQKVFASIIPNNTTSSVIENIQFYTDGDWAAKTAITDLATKIDTRFINNQNTKNSWQVFFDNVQFQENSSYVSNQNLVTTEGSLNYGDDYGGDISSKQITSLLNTPYFINSLVEGVNNEINNTSNPYKSAAYLFLNSLPLPTLREKTLLSNQSTYNLYGDYIGKTLNQVSAVHPLPSAWILKYGAIWHRYKEFTNNGSDFLSSIWDNFDANTYFNNSNGLGYTYDLNVGPNNTLTSFGGQWSPTPTSDQLNLGFYPELNNYIYYFVTGELLYDGLNISGFPITDNQVNQLILQEALFLKNAEELTITSIPTDPVQTKASLWFNYYDLTREGYLSGYTTAQYLLFPCEGGMKKSQLEFEVNTPYNLINNSNVTNGAARLVWSLSNYGYFEHNQNTFPQPDQYLKVIDSTQEEQLSFNISNNENYSSIEELFDIFTPQILDTFEEYFLNFTEAFNPDPPVYYDSEDIRSLNFQKTIREFLKIDQDKVNDSQSNTQLSYNLGQTQLNKINSTLREFLSHQTAFNFYNPKDIDILVFKSMAPQSGATPYITFGQYKGNLPPDISLNDSTTLYVNEWKELRQQVGFYSDSLSSAYTLNLIYNDSGNYVTEFFREFNIDFNVPNIKNLRKIIRMYVTARIEAGATQNIDNIEFLQRIKTESIEAWEFAQFDFINQLFIQLKKVLPQTAETEIEEFTNNSTFETDEAKLEQYQVFKTLNDKWVSGEEFSNKYLFEDFLFYDVANRDVGDKAIITTDAIANFDSINNANKSLLTIIGAILQGNFFNFMGMPSYINFYGMTSQGNTPIPKLSTQEEADAIFGTHLEVDTLDSGPKFLCQYVGPPSTQLGGELAKQSKYENDSFLLGRTAQNPLLSTDYDPQKNNKVVAFAVDFGIQSQGVFKGISLDQSEFKNTSESFAVTESMAQSANDKSILTQGLSLFNIYKTRSYTCKIEAMGNVCIQPTMYFSLRHIPMFSGPYLILDVEHTIQPNTMTTSFTGVRVPFHKMPEISQLVAKVNQTFLNKLRKKVKEEKAIQRQGGFEPESTTESNSVREGNYNFRGRDDGKLDYIIIHVTAGLKYGSNPVEKINKQHLNRGFAGIGYHYLIGRGAEGDDNSPQGTLYGARPQNKVGAHTRGHNSRSVSVSMIANCAKMGVYDKSEGGDHPTSTQKETLEWTLLWLLFDTQLFRMTDNKSVTIKTREEDVKVTNPTVLDNTGGVQSALWKSVLKGHNQFANKRCPCFRVERTLSDTGPGSLMSKLRIKLKNALESGEFSPGPDFGQASMVRYFSKRAKGKGWVPSPWSTSTGQFGGRDLASN